MQTNQDENENVSFKEFLHQYEEFKKWLEHMNTFKSVNCMSNCEKYTNHISFEEILKRSPRKELLNEYAGHVIKYYPHLKQEVLSKLRYLSKIWKKIEFTVLYKYFVNKNISKGKLLHFHLVIWFEFLHFLFQIYMMI